MMERSGSRYYYGFDVPGNVLGLFDGSGLVNKYVHTPFGQADTTSHSVTNPYRYMSRRYDDESGLYFMRARYYDPDLARFVSEDPIGLMGGINTYAFAGNDPVNSRDPMGLSPQQVMVLDQQGPYMSELEWDWYVEGLFNDGIYQAVPFEVYLGPYQGGGGVDVPTADNPTPDACADAVLAAVGASAFELTWLVPAGRAGFLAAKGAIYATRARGAQQGLRATFAFYERQIARSESRAILGTIPSSQLNSAPVDAVYTAAATPTPAHLPLSGWDFVPGAGGVRAISTARRVCSR